MQCGTACTSTSRKRLAKSQQPMTNSQAPKASSQQLKPRPAAAQEGIARAHIRRGRYRQESDSTSSAVKSVLQKVHTERWPQRIGKVGMVEQVIEIRPKLDGQPFRQLCVLGQAEVEVLVSRPPKSVAAKVAEVLTSRATLGCSIEVARYLECREVKDLAGRSGPGKRIAYQVGTPEEFAAAVEVAFKQIVDIVGLSVSQ
jgi:hypothetical protein